MKNIIEMYEDKYGHKLSIVLRSLGGDPYSIETYWQDRANNPDQTTMLLKRMIPSMTANPDTPPEVDQIHYQIIREIERLYFAGTPRDLRWLHGIAKTSCFSDNSRNYYVIKSAGSRCCALNRHFHIVTVRKIRTVTFMLFCFYFLPCKRPINAPIPYNGQPFKSTRKHAPDVKQTACGAYSTSGLPCPNALENRACVLRLLAAFLGRFVPCPYKGI